MVNFKKLVLFGACFSAILPLVSTEAYSTDEQLQKEKLERNLQEAVDTHNKKQQAEVYTQLGSVTKGVEQKDNYTNGLKISKKIGDVELQKKTTDELRKYYLELAKSSPDPTVKREAARMASSGIYQMQ